MTIVNDPTKKKKKILWIILAIVGIILVSCISCLLFTVSRMSTPEVKATLTFIALKRTGEAYKASILTATANPTMTPTPVLPSILIAMSPVTSGRGVTDAGIYDPDATGPHKLVILEPSGEGHLWADHLPPHWLPSAVSETELVVVIEELEMNIGNQSYTEGPDITRYRHDLIVTVLEARTGSVLVTTTLNGAEPSSFPEYAPLQQTRIDGNPVEFSQFIEWLSCEANLEPCLENEILLYTLMHNQPVLSVAFSPDGKTLASGSGDQTVRLWNVADGTLLNTLIHTREGTFMSVVSSVAFSPDGKTLASGSQDQIVRLWNVADGALLHSLTGHTGHVNSVAFSPDGETLISGSGDQTVRLWSVSDGILLHTLTGHTGWVNGVAFSPDGKTIASGSRDQTIRLWNAVDGALLYMLIGHTGRVNDVAFSPDGKTLASGSDDTTVRLWNVADGTLLYTLTGHTKNVSSVTFSPNGMILASASGDTTVRLWNVADGTLLYTMMAASGGVSTVAFSPDGTILATGAFNENTVRLWDLGQP